MIENNRNLVEGYIEYLFANKIYQKTQYYLIRMI